MSAVSEQTALVEIEDRLTQEFPNLAPGDYTFVVMTSDPSDGEGGGPTVDTRTVIIK